jgi:hypothetical protein
MSHVRPTQCQQCIPTVQEFTAGAMGRCTYEYAHQPTCPNHPRGER